MKTKIVFTIASLLVCGAQATTINCVPEDLEGMGLVNQAVQVDMDAQEIPMLDVPVMGCGVFIQLKAKNLVKQDYTGSNSGTTFVGQNGNGEAGQAILRIRSVGDKLIAQLTNVVTDSEGHVRIDETDMNCK
jgi:hypothetical protein